MSEFDAYFDRSVALRRQAEIKWTSASTTLHDRSPDEVAQYREIGQVLDVPTGVVEATPELFQRQVDQRHVDQVLTKAPLTTTWMQDYEHQRLARDDLENLTWFERNLGPGGRAIGRGVRRLTAVPDYFGAVAAGTRATDVGRTYDEILAEEWESFGVESLRTHGAPGWMVANAMTNATEVARMRYAAIAGQGEEERLEHIRRGAERLASAREIMRITQNIPLSDTATAFRDNTLANADDTFLGAVGAYIADPIRGAAFLAETAAETLPVLAGATAVTAVTRAPTAGVATMAGGSFLVENTTEALTFLEEQGVDFSTPEAAALVLQDRDLMARAQERGVTRGLIIAMFDALSGGIAGQALIDNPAGDLVAQGLVQAALGAGGEASAQLATGQDLDWGEIVTEGLAQIVTTPVDVLGVAGRGLPHMVSRLGRSGETATALEEIDAQVAASRLRDRAPDMFLDALEAQGLGEQALYVPADALREYFQSKDEGGEARMRAWGLDPQAFEEAALAGADVSIPLSTYAASIADTEDVAWFHDHAVQTPEEMSVAEAAEFNDRIQDIVSEELESAGRARLDAEETRASDIQIYDQMFAQLRAAGRSPDVAQNEAAVWSAFWRTMGERYGADPLDLARAMGVEVRGSRGPGTLRRDQLNVALDALRTKDKSLTQFVSATGGVRDADDRVGAFDSPQGVVATDDAQGVSLEKMAEMAAEAGYFVNPPTADEFVQALSKEAIGRRIDVDDQILQDLSDALTAQGLDLSLSNDEIAASLSETGGTTLDQPGKRGSIQFPRGGLSDGQTIINLFEGADLSTFLHESGHFFLEAFGELAATKNAPQAMKDDLTAIHKWLGVAETSEIEAKHHEKWARGFEAYLMEGKAPSLALADAFARFKAWMIRIYRIARGFDAKITREVREVMDRMLATDAEITEARAEVAMRPLFAEAPPGMSEGEFTTYRRLARRATESAEQALLEKTMAKVQREKQAWYKQEKSALRAEVAAEFDRQPRYRLIDLLANRRWNGDLEEGAVQTIPDLRIDRDMLVEQFGDVVLAEMSRTRFGGKRAIYGPDGMSPQEAAEFFGFRSPFEMVEILRETPKKADAIASEVDRRMVERYGDPLHDGSIEEEALAAIHSEQQMALSVSEARHAAARLGRSTRGLSTRLYRQRARDMLGRMVVRDAVRTDRYLTAERRAARAAQAAFAKVAKGDGEAALAEALRAKEQQILNGFLYNEARQFAAEVQTGREKMRRYGKASIRKKLEGGYIEQIDAILDDYDFRKRSGAQVARAESLKDFVDRMLADGARG